MAVVFTKPTVISYFADVDVSKAIDEDPDIFAAKEESFSIYQSFGSSKKSPSHFIHPDTVHALVETGQPDVHIAAKVTFAINDHFVVLAVIERYYRPVVSSHYGGGNH